MNVSIYQKEVFAKYHSNSQIARVLTERWFEEEMYCPNCLHTEFLRYPNNTKVKDFRCNNCCNEYQLKAQSRPFYSKVDDGAFEPMIHSIQLGTTPSFSFMSYSIKDWIVDHLFVVPKFFFSKSIIEKRKISYPSGRPTGWTGCNIVLSKLPELGKIKVIDNGTVLSKSTVHKTWKDLSFMEKKNPEGKAWTADVLCCIQKLTKKEFTLDEMYEFEDYLAELHPRNYHVKPKIRQQLQILRDSGILKFKERGIYLLNR